MHSPAIGPNKNCIIAPVTKKLFQLINKSEHVAHLHAQAIAGDRGESRTTGSATGLTATRFGSRLVKLSGAVVTALVYLLTNGLPPRNRYFAALHIA